MFKELKQLFKEDKELEQQLEEHEHVRKIIKNNKEVICTTNIISIILYILTIIFIISLISLFLIGELDISNSSILIGSIISCLVTAQIIQILDDIRSKILYDKNINEDKKN